MRLVLVLILFAQCALSQTIGRFSSYTPPVAAAGGPVTFSTYSANIKAGDGTGDTVDVQVTVPSGLTNAIAIAGVSLRYTYGTDVVDVQNVTDAVPFARAEVRDAEHHGSIWYQTGITEGAKTFRLTCDGSTGNCLWVAIYYNAAQTAPIRDSAFASGNSATPTVNISSDTGDLVIDHIYEYNGSFGSTLTAGAGQTKRIDYDEGGTPIGHIAMSEEVGAATTTMSWTIGAAKEYTLVTVSVKRAN
jgi:hypothetical protein